MITEGQNLIDLQNTNFIQSETQVHIKGVNEFKNPHMMAESFGGEDNLKEVYNEKSRTFNPQKYKEHYLDKRLEKAPESVKTQCENIMSLLDNTITNLTDETVKEYHQVYEEKENFKDPEKSTSLKQANMVYTLISIEAQLRAGIEPETMIAALTKEDNPYTATLPEGDTERIINALKGSKMETIPEEKSSLPNAEQP